MTHIADGDDEIFIGTVRNEKTLTMIHEAGNKADDIFGMVYNKLQK